MIPFPVPNCNTPVIILQCRGAQAYGLLLLAFFLVLFAAWPAQAQFGGGITDAIESDDAAAVRQELISGKNANAKDAEGTPLLVIAATHNRVLIGRLLLQSGARISGKDAKGDTALTMAIRKGNREFAKMLLDQEADPNMAGSNGETPLMVAVVTGSADMVQALVNAKADVEAADYTGHTPLDEAERRGMRRIADILRKAGATQ